MPHLSSSSFPYASNEHIAGHCEQIFRKRTTIFSVQIRTHNNSYSPGICITLRV